MSSRAVYVYRLHVQLPPQAADPYWVPPTYSGRFKGEDYDGEPLRFPWPARRLYLSGTAAAKRAQLLRSWGCTVDVERSQRVVFGAQLPLARV